MREGDEVDDIAPRQAVEFGDHDSGPKLIASRYTEVLTVA